MFSFFLWGWREGEVAHCRGLASRWAQLLSPLGFTDGLTNNQTFVYEK